VSAAELFVCPSSITPGQPVASAPTDAYISNRWIKEF